MFYSKRLWGLAVAVMMVIVVVLALIRLERVGFSGEVTDAAQESSATTRVEQTEVIRVQPESR